MNSLMRVVGQSSGLACVTGAIVISGQAAVFLAIGLTAISFALIATLALAGTFASSETRQAAQAVLAILLNRVQPQIQPPPESATDSPGTARQPQFEPSA